mmetsp:Transcript_10033/g.37201  ORF Transcript_10033/g.37201 Transcript_10033/m.37201 type:complete len:136 (-) Transcript_10033:1045-1452(-)|eukprot:CAMPEP_0117642286 /NCGR_PEP_ID=MMETSP0802-20121206/9787_1 /TAXON_ID=38833 /ORGANISM="Micromonas sp., Strain CCMP2099" /LENGTH=135 /DNA_ID=CAMNT_0005447291 /DNA_START=68 /DNA_END=475 /DNA_ORIENTATION=-
MPRFFCDFCDSALTHDSENARKQHRDGFKHKANVRNYYAQFQAQVSEKSQAAAMMENSPAVAYQMQVTRVLQQQMGPPGGYGGYPGMGGGTGGGPLGMHGGPPGMHGGPPGMYGGPPGMNPPPNLPPPPGNGFGR